MLLWTSEKCCFLFRWWISTDWVARGSLKLRPKNDLKVQITSKQVREANTYSTVLCSGDTTVACCRAMPWLSLCPTAQSLGNEKEICWPHLVQRAGAELPIAQCKGAIGFAMRLAPGGCIYIAFPSLKKKEYTSWRCCFGLQELSLGKKKPFLML